MPVFVSGRNLLRNSSFEFSLQPFFSGSDDNIYAVANSGTSCFRKYDKDGNLLWSIGVANGWGTDVWPEGATYPPGTVRCMEAMRTARVPADAIVGVATDGSRVWLRKLSAGR